MSKNSVDRRQSSFKARDNVEIIMDRIIVLIESNFSSSIIPQLENAGTWECDGEKAEIKVTLDTPFRNMDGRTILLQCGISGTVSVATPKTWLLNVLREKLVDTTFKLMEHVNTANGIHPITIMEFDERRLNQDKALTDCYHILHILQQAIHFLNVKPSKIENIVELIEEELRLIKGWRRSEHKKRAAILKREQGQ